MGDNNDKSFIEFVTGQTETSKHLAGKHNQDRHGLRAGGEATSAQRAARQRAAAGRAKPEPDLGIRQSPKTSGDRFKKGDLVEYKKPYEDEVGIKYRLLEEPDGGRVLVEAQVPMVIKPTYRVKLDDIKQSGSEPDLGIRQSPAKPVAPAVQQGGWKTGSNYISKKVGDTMATIYTFGGKESTVVIASKGINTTFRYDDHLGDAKALADAALRGEFDHPIIKADFDGLVKNYGLTNSYGPMKRDEWDRFKLGIATSRSQLISKYRHGMDEISTVNPKSIGIGTAVIPKTGLFKGVPMRIKGFGGKDMRIDPFSGLPYGKANYYIAMLYGSDGGDRFSQTAWRGLDTGIEIKIPTSDI